MPDTAVAGTAQEAFWVQLPQSTSPVPTSVTQLGWLLSTVGSTVATRRAPSPL